MDLFPLVLSSRDMNTLMRLVEQIGMEETLPRLSGVESGDDIDSVQRVISQMDSREMSKFLGDWSSHLSGLIQDMGGVNPGTEQEQDYIEIKKAQGVVEQMRKRVKR